MVMKEKSTLTSRGREMYALIERYQSSGEKQRIFCEKAGVSLTTFQYWLYRYRAEKGQKKGFHSKVVILSAISVVMNNL